MNVVLRPTRTWERSAMPDLRLKNYVGVLELLRKIHDMKKVYEKIIKRTRRG